MADADITSPARVPQQYKPHVELLSQMAQHVMNAHGWPYSVQATMAQCGYTTLSDLADRWDTTAAAREKAAAHLKFPNGWDDEKKELMAMKVMQAVRKAQIMIKDEGAANTIGTKVTTCTGGTNETVLLQHKRHSMEAQWKVKTGGHLKAPPLEEQPSDQMIKVMWNSCETGIFHIFDLNKIISALPQPSDRGSPTRKRKLTDGGAIMEYEEELGKWPKEKREWEKLMTIWKHTVLMVPWCFASYAKFNLDKETVESFYEFLLGRNILGRSPEPPIIVVSKAERLAWREVVHAMHQGKDAKTALKDVVVDTLFWTREVYEKLHMRDTTQHQFTKVRELPYKGGQQSKGKGKQPYKSYGGKNNNDTWKGDSRKGGGKGKSAKSKGKQGKDKGKKQYQNWPQNWARKDKDGTPICANYVFHRGCNGGCGKSHKCPVQKSGWICNASDHHPNQCPYK